jgi:RimJ/RimL family protein N-acetyltransferase
MQRCPDEIRTDRLILRRWREEDISAFTALETDPQARRFFPGVLPSAEAEADARRHAQGFDSNGFDLWVLECPGKAPFIGVAGLRRVERKMPFKPRVDVGWKLCPRYWGNGYATEAAEGALDDVFTRTDLTEIVSYTARLNEPSRRVMRRLGMTHDAGEDFEHPSVPEGHPLRPHVLYRLTRAAFYGGRRPR